MKEELNSFHKDKDKIGWEKLWVQLSSSTDQLL